MAFKDIENLCGRRFGLLKVFAKVGDLNHNIWLCQCRCKKYLRVNQHKLLAGKTICCPDCTEKYYKALSSKERRLRSRYGKQLYELKTAHPDEYKYWKRVDKRGWPDLWIESFFEFFDDMGEMPDPKATLVPHHFMCNDFNKNTVRWGTRTERKHAGHTRTGLIYKYDGRYLTHNQAMEEFGLPNIYLSRWRKRFKMNLNTLVTVYERRQKYMRMADEPNQWKRYSDFVYPDDSFYDDYQEGEDQ